MSEPRPAGWVSGYGGGSFTVAVDRHLASYPENGTPVFFDGATFEPDTPEEKLAAAMPKPTLGFTSVTSAGDALRVRSAALNDGWNSCLHYLLGDDEMRRRRLLQEETPS